MPKVKLLVKQARYQQLEKELISLGFTIDEDAELIITERELFVDHLIVKETESKQRVNILTDDIVVIESYGHDVLIHTKDQKFKTDERLYQLERMLDPRQFLRISNSVIIALNRIRRINPTLSSKFILTMSNGLTVDVTRSYYGIFKDHLGI